MMRHVVFVAPFPAETTMRFARATKSLGDVRVTGVVNKQPTGEDAGLFGDMAHVLVLYEARIPGSGRPPQLGVDSFQLIRKQGRWWIAGVINELPTPERPVPAELFD